MQTKVSSINYTVTANQDNWGILNSQGPKCISVKSYKSNNSSMPFKILISIFRVKLEEFSQSSGNWCFQLWKWKKITEPRVSEEQFSLAKPN